MRARLPWVVVFVCVAGCGDDDGAASTDAGPSIVDAGARMDAGADSGSVLDAGSQLDAATADDAGPGADADVSSDAATDAGGSDAATAVDAALADAEVTDAAFDPLTNVVVTHPASAPIAPATECTVTTADAVRTDAAHVVLCTDIAYETDPPCYGSHYGEWADFRSYADPVPWGYLVHAMEHGATVIAVGCGASCPGVIPALQAFVDAYPADPLCSATSARSRIIVVPVPTLGIAITASAWGHLYRATCLDTASLTAFLDAHYGMAPEDFCSPGVDHSAAGWCAPDAG